MNWRGTTYPMGGLTVLQQVTYLHQLQERDPHSKEEQKAYMEGVTKHVGQAILKCEGRTMTNIGLYGSDAKKIAELSKRVSYRASTNLGMMRWLTSEKSFGRELIGISSGCERVKNQIGRWPSDN